MSLGCIVVWLYLCCPVLWGDNIAMDSELGAPSLDRPIFSLIVGVPES